MKLNLEMKTNLRRIKHRTACCMIFSCIMLGGLMCSQVSVAGNSKEMQQSKKTVSGTVLDEKGEALIGVSVVEKGTVNGTTTDENGYYSIVVSNVNASLMFSFVGFHSQEIALDGKTHITVTLIENTKILDEVVVIGYGTQRKGDVTSAVSSVKAEDFTPGKINQNELIGDTRSHYTQATGNISVEPIRGWVTNLMLSLKENTSTGQNYYTSQYYSQRKESVKGAANKSSANIKSENLELTTKYDFTLNKHRVSALAGYSYLYSVYDGFSAGNRNFPSESYLYNNLGLGTYLTDDDQVASMSSYKYDSKLVGFFGRVSYGYDDRYNAMVSVRHEGSSKFGDNHKWGTFPSVSLGWNINNEQFMKDLKWLDHLKLRLGYGVTGVIPNDPYMSINMFNFDPYGKHLSQSGTWTNSLMISQNPNSELKWEKTGEWNLGLDWGVLNGRLGGSLDLYNKKTVDLLYEYNVPLPPNMYETTVANVGKMRNKGIELMINAIPVKTKDFEYNVPLSGTVGKHIQRLRVYASGSNLFCITGYSGLDPEVSNYYMSPDIDDRDKYPTIRSFTFGLNINF